MSAKLTVVYEDGSRESFNPNKPKFLLAMERKFGVQQPEKHEHVSWLAWFALGKPAGDLDKWLENVEEFDQDDDETEADVSGEADPS